MDRKPQLPPRPGAVPQLPPRPRPVPPAPPRQINSFSLAGLSSTIKDPNEQQSSEQYKQPTVADDLEHVTNSFERLQTGPALNPNSWQSPATNHARSTYNDPTYSNGRRLEAPVPTPVSVSKIVRSRETTSRAFIRECPERDPVNFPTLWYFPVHANKFTICSHCYMTIIRGVECAGISFNSFMGTADQTLFCMFGKPRAKNLFGSGNFQALKVFMASRVEVKSCQGAVNVNGKANMTWYRATNRDIDGLVSCEACHEDHIVETSFYGHFEKSPPQPLDQMWSCDMAVPGVRLALEKCSDRGDWRGFVAAATRRLTIPACTPYKERATESTKWYRTDDTLNLPGVVVCEACYLDGIAGGFMEKYFTPGLGSGHRHQKSLVCTVGYLPMAINLHQAIFTENFQTWYETTRIFMREEICSGTAQQRNSYMLKEGNIDFNVCYSCYTCYIDLFGFGSHFKEVATPTGNVWACDFHPTRHGFPKYTAALNEAIFVGDFSIVKDFIVRYQGVTQPCPRSTFWKGRSWYGNGDFSACSDCFEEVIRGTRLESAITFRNQVVPTENSCDIYSPRMRGLWKEACANNDYAGFAELARHRSQVYYQTVPVMNRLLSQQRIRLMQQQTLNGSSLLYKRLDMSVSSRINYTGVAQPITTYGAADVGYGFASTYGVEAARLGQQANNLSFSNGSQVGNVAYLEAMWEAVE